jgi:hypothetical protein
MAYTKIRCVLAWAFILLYPGLGKAEDPLARLTVLALAPMAGQAVVQGPDGSLHLVRLDDQIQGTNATLVQVLPDKLVLEERSPGTGQGPVQRLVWLYKAAQDGGPSRLVRLQREVPASERPAVPLLQPVPVPQ